MAPAPFLVPHFFRVICCNIFKTRSLLVPFFSRAPFFAPFFLALSWLADYASQPGNFIIKALFCLARMQWLTLGYSLTLTLPNLTFFSLLFCIIYNKYGPMVQKSKKITNSCLPEVTMCLKLELNSVSPDQQMSS